MEQAELDQLFGSEHFKSFGSPLLELLSSYLEESVRGQVSVMNWCPPTQASGSWDTALPREPALDKTDLLVKIRDEILAANLRVHHPRNLGHQVAPPLPMAALADLVSALTNQAMAVYETGPSATLIERQVLKWLGELIGWKGAEGVLTSGGAQANLTALLAARQSMAGWDVWKTGVASGAPLRILASEHTHYSVSRAAGIMGLGCDAVLSVATDINGCMDMMDLQHQWQESIVRGEQPFVVVGAAGCTPTGSIDPLEEIGAFCKAHRLWFHVDGAHGASALLSNELKARLSGITQADSVIWDGHKLLYMPATVSAVIFRNPKHSYAAFSQEASYLFHGDSHESEQYNTSYRTLECTKRMMGLKLWVAFMLYGTDRLGAIVEQVFDSANRFAAMLESVDDFELLMTPQTNIVCFRHLPEATLAPEPMNTYQTKLRSALVESGAFHLTQATISGAVWLRATVMNPYTTPEDFGVLLQSLRTLSKSIQM